MMSIGPDVAAAAACCGTPAIFAVAPNSATITANHAAAVMMTIWRILFSPRIDVGSFGPSLNLPPPGG